MERLEFVAIREDSLLLIIDIQQVMQRVIDRWGIIAISSAFSKWKVSDSATDDSVSVSHEVKL